MAATVAMPTSEGANIEAKIRHTTQTKRIRVSEFFKDYDPLRSGFISETQFCRCLDQHIGLKLSQQDREFLAGKYGARKPGMIDYRTFSAALENAFNPNILDGQPNAQIQNFQSTSAPSAELSPEQLQLTDAVLQKCREYYKCHGISVKSCYCDFDKHHRGFVTKSQFHRSFPGPSEVTPAEIAALAQRYLDPANGLHNYLLFHSDITAPDGRGSGEGLEGEPHPPAVTKTDTASLDEIFQRVRDAVYKNGIRTTEFFRDHDKLRSGVITENQFTCGLSLCCGRTAHLTREEIQAVVEHYRTPDGRVSYKLFCDLMENAYNRPDFEKQPTATVYRPLRGHLSQPLNQLGSEGAESRVQAVLERLKGEVRRRRLLLYPYFRDFDRGKGYTRGVTKPQFERLLHFLSLEVTPEELKLIVAKFEAPNRGDVNYVAFIQTVDEEYTGQVLEQEPTTTESADVPAVMSSPVEGGGGEGVRGEGVRELLARLQEWVYCNRIRVCEHFQDFDPLRTGSISAARFRQGLSALGQPYLSEPQFSVLCQHYANSKQRDCVNWKRFVDDIDQVFFPGGSPGCSEPRPLLRPGAVDFSSSSGASESERAALQSVLHRLRERAATRRVLAKPTFQDFDRHHMGYVTCGQFRQCLSVLGMSAGPDETALMERRFADDKGFNYLAFLEELQPAERLEDKYQTRMGTLLLSKQDTASTKPGGEGSKVTADQVLNKIKTKVSKERIRVLEFMRDYDKLRSGRIPLTSFRRALDIGGFELSQEEVDALKDRYLSSKDPSCVNYMQFSDEVESVFTTKNLERTPTAEVRQFVPRPEVDPSRLLPEEEQILQKTMHRLAEKVRVRRIQIFPLFEDYDKVHIGNVTRSQFHRVLSELELGGMVNAFEFGIIYRKFEGRSGVNYISFCEMIDEYAQTKWSDPTLK